MGALAERACECLEHGREAVDRRARPALPVDRARGNRQDRGDAGGVRDRGLRGAHESVVHGCRVAIDRGFDTGLTGLGIGSRDHARDLARDVEVHRALRLQHAHQLREVEATGEWEPRSHLGNVAHCASLWTVVQGTVAVTGVSGFIGQRLLPLLDASPDVTRIVGLDVRDPAPARPQARRSTGSTS